MATKRLIMTCLSISMALLIFFGTISLAEEENEIALFVTASKLNGRIKPSRGAEIVAKWPNGAELIPTGKWSRDHQWIQVIGGETQYAWVHIGYFSEQLTGFTAWNREYDKVKIRSRPIDGRITGYLKKGQEIEIEQLFLGWGKTEKGWIDLRYIEERDYEP